MDRNLAKPLMFNDSVMGQLSIAKELLINNVA